MDQTTTIQEAKNQFRKFCEVRSWELYNSPKNLAMALGVESGELTQIFQAETPEKEAVENELAHIFNLVMEFCNCLKIDLCQVLQRRISYYDNRKS